MIYRCLPATGAPACPRCEAARDTRHLGSRPLEEPRQAQRGKQPPAAPRDPGHVWAGEGAFFPASISTPSITQDYSIRTCDASLLSAKTARLKNYVHVCSEQAEGGLEQAGRACGRGDTRGRV